MAHHGLRLPLVSDWTHLLGVKTASSSLFTTIFQKKSHTGALCHFPLVSKLRGQMKDRGEYGMCVGGGDKILWNAGHFLSHPTFDPSPSRGGR